MTTGEMALGGAVMALAAGGLWMWNSSRKQQQEAAQALAQQQQAFARQEAQALAQQKQQAQATQAPAPVQKNDPLGGAINFLANNAGNILELAGSIFG